MWKLRAVVFVLIILCTIKQPCAQSLNKPVNNGQRENIEAANSLKLPAAQSNEVQQALAHHDNRQAQTLLITEINATPDASSARNDLILLGDLFFRDAKYLSAWTAWDKAQAIAPLDDDSLFSMAMADLELKRPDRTRMKIEELERRNPRSAAYGYWHARMDYDARQYLPAITQLQKVVALDPSMTRAYDRLGLCYLFMGRPDTAVAALQRAVALNRRQMQPSAWPDEDLAVALSDTARWSEARTALQEALLYNNSLPQAHYQLGLVLEHQGHAEEARAELDRAVELDGTYPEPHFALQRIFSAMGKREEAAVEGATFQRLKNPQAAASLETQ